VLAVDGLRSVDLHRYRARLSLSPGCDARAVWDEVARAIEVGGSAPLTGEPPPRVFEVAYERPRILAESPEMAAPDPLSRLCFGSPGWPRPSSWLATYGSGRAVCSPGRKRSLVRWALRGAEGSALFLLDPDGHGIHRQSHDPFPLVPA
jgi:hypothetical protein